MQFWYKGANEHRLTLINNAQRLGFEITNSGGIVNNYYYGLTSYMLRNSRNELYNYLRAYSYYINNQDNENVLNGRTEHAVLCILSKLHPEIQQIIQTALPLKDRSNTDKTNPANGCAGLHFCYLPKGITDIEEQMTDLSFNAEIGAKIQRQIIKENIADPDLTDEINDHRVTIKVATGELPSGETYFYVFFNKRHTATLRRVIYKGLAEGLRKLIKPIDLEETEKPIFYTLLNTIEDPDEQSLQTLTDITTPWINNLIENAEANLIPEFSKSLQTAMNSKRLDQLRHEDENARVTLERNIAEYTCLHNAYLQAHRALQNYSEVEFTAIKDLLIRIQKSDTTRAFGLYNENELYFIIEEPLIHTESETWSKILSNPKSDINNLIYSFATKYHDSNVFEEKFDFETIRFAMQRLIKAIFIDKTYQLHTAAKLSISKVTSNFQINKKYFSNNECYFPHPHIGTNELTCWSEATREIHRAVMQNDGESAFLQLKYALQQLTASDNVVSRAAIKLIFNSKYKNYQVYSEKGKTERLTVLTILRRFINEELEKLKQIEENLNASDQT